MGRLQLSFASGAHVNRLDPLHDGRERPEGIELVCSHVTPAELFWRQLKYQEFDVSEMSLSSLLITWSKGSRDWMALPVFPRRDFFHTRLVVRDGAGIEHPEQLAGKRIGVPEYQQTAAVWIRGVLSDEFGVRPEAMRWFMERPAQLSHGASTRFVAPADVELSYIPPGDSMTAMMGRGELDAVTFWLPERSMMDRSHIDDIGAGFGRHLFPERAAESTRYFAKTGIYPINHCIVVRRSLAETHPWVPLNLYQCFERARQRVVSQFWEYLTASADLGLLPRLATLPDPMPYGLAANRLALETLLRYEREQELLEGVVTYDELVAPACLES